MGLVGATSEAGNESYDRGNVVDYRLARTSSGWDYAALNPTATRYDRSSLLAIGAVAGANRGLWGAQEDSFAHKEDIYLQEASGELKSVGPGEIPALAGTALATSEELDLVGAASDLATSVYAITNEPGGVGHHDVWPGDTTRREGSSLYEYRYGGAAAAEPTLVGVRNQGALHGSPHVNEGAELASNCGTELGSMRDGSAYNAISEDGETVFFTALACGGAPVVNELYARVAASRTVAISEPNREDCEVCNTASEVKSATFVGASANGQRAFFMTEQPLLPGQKGMSLYAYDFSAPAASAANPDGRIALVSQAPKPEVQGVVRISEDGSHVYFVARGVLAGANAEGHAPATGADNLYVYEPDPAHAGASHVVFVATLLTPAGEAEAMAREEAIEAQAFARAVAFWEAHCPPAFENFSCIAEVEAVLAREVSALGYFDVAETLSEDKAVWQREDDRPAQATPDGRFLVFPSSAALTPDDTSPVPQLFEYDAQGGPSGSGSLTRVSIGQGGSYDGDGSVGSFREAPQIPRPSFESLDLPSAAGFGLSVSGAGSKVFFTSAAPLTPLAVSGQPSLFEYSEGNVYLISDGHDTSTVEGGLPAVQLYGANPSGSDVFFTTVDQLTPQAADTQQAIYDAREEGGFPAPALAPGCLGETCRGATGEAPAVVLDGTSAQAGEEGLTVAPATGPIVTTPASKRGSAARARQLARALKECARFPRRRRAGCRAAARRRYGPQARGGLAGSSGRVGTHKQLATGNAR